MPQMFDALPRDEQADQNHHAGTDVRHFAREFAEAFEVFGRMPDGERGQRADRDERDGQSQTERQHDGEPEGELFELQADQQHRKRGGTGQQPARQPEQDQLPRRHLPVGKAVLKLPGMFALVGICKFFAVRAGGRMVMMIFHKLGVVFDGFTPAA